MYYPECFAKQNVSKDSERSKDLVAIEIYSYEDHDPSNQPV